MFQPDFSIQRVCVVGEESLFEQGITSLLALGTGLSISGLKYRDDSALLADIEQTMPDVILLRETASFDIMHVLKLLYSKTSITARYVIVVRLENSTVDVYDMPKRFAVTKGDELVAVVQGRFNLFKPGDVYV